MEQRKQVHNQIRDSPERRSWKARGRLRQKEKQIRESLKGCFDEYHRMLFASLYKHYQFLSAEIENIEQRVASHLEPYAEQVELYTTIPGVDRLLAWHLIAELGPDMSVFPEAGNCAAWAGLVPGENESASLMKQGDACVTAHDLIRQAEPLSMVVNEV